MTLVVKQNGTDISASVDWKSVQVSLVLTKEISKFQWMMRQTAYSPTLAINDTIDVYQNGAHIFGGTLTEMETTIAGGILPVINYTATDWSFALNKKLVVKTYTNMDPADILADIITNFAPAGYDTTTYVQRGGFLVPSIKLNYEQVTKAIQKLATLIGWDWNVDADKKVHFFLNENISAPFDIEDANDMLEWPSLDIDIDLTNMKNSVYVIGGKYDKTFTAGNTPDNYKTDGVQQAFQLAYAYDQSTIVITLAGVTQTFGILNQVTDPSTVQVLYDPTAPNIQFTTTPTAGQTVQVYGKAKIPIIAHAQDSAGIANYGEIQDVIIDSQITTIAEAQQRAQADILQYGHAVYDVKFNTLQTGLAVGQTIYLNSAKLGYTNIPLIIKRLTGNGYSPTQILWQVECYGSDVVTFVDLMSGLLQAEAQTATTDSTILENLIITTEPLALTDSVAVFHSAEPYFWGPTSPNEMYWNLFAWD